MLAPVEKKKKKTKRVEWPPEGVPIHLKAFNAGT